MAKGDKNKPEGPSFEQAIEQLTQIVSRIEQGQVPLQESLEQYEKGMKLIQYCRGILQDAEKRIEEISTAAPASAERPVAEQGQEQAGDNLF